MHPDPLLTWLQGGFFFPYKNYKVFYRQQGEGPSVVLLHGFPAASWYWHKIWNELTRHARLLAPDLLGFGFSDKPPDYAYSIADQADVIEYLVSEVGKVDFHLLAHDYGAAVALELVARLQEKKAQKKSYFRIQSVCLLNACLFNEDCQLPRMHSLMASTFGSLAPRQLARALMNQQCRLYAPPHQPTPQERSCFLQLLQHNNGFQVMPLLSRYVYEQNTLAGKWKSALKELDIPLQLIWGTDDPMVGTKAAATLKQLNPRLKIILLDNTGHFPHLETPEKVIEHYTRFLSRKF
ncbi:MAG: epoxide hydrolase [Chitinophagales bacterium]|nr:MAG: epoxide hydrolase [Chitinophagales bacterium]